jgi:hypothetical protein
MRHEKKAFANETIELDGNDFIDCTFSNCKFVYAGGDFNIERIRFDSLELTAEGAAARTVMLLRSLWADELGRRLVLGLLDPTAVQTRQ